MGLRNRKSLSSILRKRRFQQETLESRIVLDSTVVFNEIMFNPVGDDTGQEWIEFYNQLNVDMDISDWVVDGGVDYTFPDHTIVPARGHVVLAADPAKMAESGIKALGPWEGNLNNNGETLRLYNNSGRRMNEVSYNDNGDWPVAPDGGGVALAKSDRFSASHLAENWTFSQQLGGSPGEDNFVRPGSFRYDEIIPEAAPVRAIVPSNGSMGLDWIQAGFDDSGWLVGTTGVGHEGRTGYESYLGLNMENPPNGQTAMPVEDVNATIYMRIPFEYDTSKTYETLTLGMRYDDGFIVYLNGTEILRENAPDNATWNSEATASNSDRNAVAFEE
ncbi:MAG: lamin tail domain-containing protein, partial [Planctomycetales bacterium]|nr:lamin tail domain-containing protein [Planctomycetales bacterium]